MNNRRRYSVQKKQEQISRKQFQEHLEQFEWITTDIDPDLGEDILIRIYQDGKTTGLSLYAQLKSVKNIDSNLLKSGIISYGCRVADLEHWEAQVVPVFLIVWDINLRTGWWISIMEAITNLDKRILSWREKNRVQIHIPTDNALDANGLSRIRHIIANKYFSIVAKDKDFDISAKFSFPKTIDGQEKLEELQRFIKFGDKLELDNKYIELFDLPDWWRRLYGKIDLKDIHLRMETSKSTEVHAVQIDFISPDCGSERVPYVELCILKQGEEEITLSNEQQNIPAKFIFRINKLLKQYHITFKFQIYNSDLIYTLQMLRIQKIIGHGGTTKVTMLETGDIDSLSFAPETLITPPDALIRYVENLVFIQQAIGRIMKLHDEKAFSLENIKSADELVSIFRSGNYRQIGQIFTIELQRQAVESVLEVHEKGEPIHFRLSTDESYVDLLGEHFDLGPMTQDIKGKWEMPVDEVIAWLENADNKDYLEIRLLNVELNEEFENWLKKPAN